MSGTRLGSVLGVPIYLVEGANLIGAESFDIANVPSLLSSVTVYYYPTKVVFTAEPSNTAAGASITPAVQVSVEDANSNVVTSDNSNVTVAIGTNPGGGTLGGTLTVAAVNGVATFDNLSINKPGTGYTLTAADGSLSRATSAASTLRHRRRSARYRRRQPRTRVTR